MRHRLAGSLGPSELCGSIRLPYGAHFNQAVNRFYVQSGSCAGLVPVLRVFKEGNVPSWPIYRGNYLSCYRFLVEDDRRVAVGDSEISRMVEHHFGGPWTELKLDAVCYYLECYTKALSQRQFDLWYVDVFAGTGDRTNEKLTGGLLERQPMRWVTETLPGSAKRAMSIKPPFKHFIFNESDDDHQKALREIKRENKSLDIEIIGDDANVAIKEIFSRQVWKRGAFGGARAVVFLDPYALQVDWVTLEFLAKTQCADVWYLFPLHDVTRQLAKKLSGVGTKEKRLDKVLGPAWRELYELPPPRNKMFERTLFGSIPEFAEEEYRNATKA
jgi:three-Cys-motif partner protein